MYISKKRVVLVVIALVVVVKLIAGVGVWMEEAKATVQSAHSMSR